MTATAADLDRVKTTRIAYLRLVRRTYTRDQLRAAVGWVGDCEVHTVRCPDYEAGAVRRQAIRVGSLFRVFDALIDDFAAGQADFPALHDCLRTPAVSRRPSST